MAVRPWARPQTRGDLGRPLSSTRHFAEAAFMNRLPASHFIGTNMRCWEPAGHKAVCEFGVRSGRARVRRGSLSGGDGKTGGGREAGRSGQEHTPWAEEGCSPTQRPHQTVGTPRPDGGPLCPEGLAPLPSQTPRLPFPSQPRTPNRAVWEQRGPNRPCAHSVLSV